jgi:hypothetical protein
MSQNESNEPCTTITTPYYQEQDQEQTNNNDNDIVVELAEFASRIFAKRKEIEKFLNGLSYQKCVGVESWTISD